MATRGSGPIHRSHEQSGVLCALLVSKDGKEGQPCPVPRPLRYVTRAGCGLSEPVPQSGLRTCLVIGAGKRPVTPGGWVAGWNDVAVV